MYPSSVSAGRVLVMNVRFPELGSPGGPSRNPLEQSRAPNAINAASDVRLLFLGARTSGTYARYVGREGIYI
jgi:hypothetical protein